MRLWTTPATVCLLFLSAQVASGESIGDTLPETGWGWRVSNVGMFNSRLALYENRALRAAYEVECDLADAALPDHGDPEAPGVALVMLKTRKDPLAVVDCVVGAHSRMVSVYDPSTKSPDPVFSRTGSYLASWIPQGGRLRIEYDLPCARTDCELPFETVMEHWP